MASSGSVTTNTAKMSDSAGTSASLTFSWTQTKNVGSNTSTINWTISVNGSWSGFRNSDVYLNRWYGGEWHREYTSSSRFEMRKGWSTSSSFTVYHDDSSGAAGFEIYLAGAMYDRAYNWTAQKAWSLDTIPRASTFGKINNFNLEDAFTVNVDKKNSSFTDTLEMLIDNEVIKTVSNYSSRSISLTNEELARAYNLINNSSSSKVVKFRVTTKNGSSTIGSNTSGDITASISGTSRVNVNGTWRRAVPWIRANGVWRRSVSNVNINGTWKRCV